MYSNSSPHIAGSILPKRQAPHLAEADGGRKPASWWTPVWRGLAADPDGKHRDAMGSAVWLYLYLLTYANRKTGTVHRTQEAIVADTGYARRTLQSHLSRLRKAGYLTVQGRGRYLKIDIQKWKGFQVGKAYPEPSDRGSFTRSR